jgi:hypothetical protein
MSFRILQLNPQWTSSTGKLQLRCVKQMSIWRCNVVASLGLTQRSAAGNSEWLLVCLSNTFSVGGNKMGIDTPSDATAPSNQTPDSSSWVGRMAADSWSATSGALRVAGQLSVGFASQVYEHPGETLAEVAGAALIAGGAAEAGIGVLGAAAIAAVPAAAYGLYRAEEITRTEGVSAIPTHIAQTYDQARAFAAISADAVASVYQGSTGHGDLAQAKQKVQDLGAMTVPLAAAAVGGAGGELGATVLRGGASLLRGLADATLPTLTLEPAYVNIGRVAFGGATTSSAGLETTAAAAATTTGAAAIHEMRAPTPEAGGSGDTGLGPTADEEKAARIDVYANKQVFVDGRLAAAAKVVAPDSGSAEAGLRRVFTEADKILADGGRAGNIELSQAPHGWLEAKFVAGPLKDTIALYEPGTDSFMVERSADAADAHIFKMQQ